MDAISHDREHLIALVKTVCSCAGTEDEVDGALDQLQAALPLVPWSDFIFWPSGFPHDPTKPQPTAEQIVDRALSFVPSIIILPPASHDA